MGISTEKEAEQRATSALLAVVTIVRDFSKSLLDPLGAPKGSRVEVEAFTEVEIALPDGTKARPDGLIRVNNRGVYWTALVEVKTGDGRLRAEQINKYLLAAREVDASVVLTISNELGMAGAHPTDGLNVRSNSKVQVAHLAWTQILATAIQHKIHAGVDDPEQEWIIGELIRYLEHPASGTVAMSDMGPDWVSVRDAARGGLAKRTSPEVAAVATKWDELIRYTAIRLGSETGVAVTQVLSKSENDPATRLASLCKSLEDDGVFSGDLKIPDAAGEISVQADLRARQIVVSTTIAAPGDKKGRGSVSWLTKQIPETAPAGLVIDAYAKKARTPVSATLAEAVEDPTVLLGEKQTDIARFVLTARFEMGQGRGTGKKTPGFIESVLSAVDRLYADVLQNITPWRPKAPKVKKSPSNDQQPQPRVFALPERLDSAGWSRSVAEGTPIPSTESISES